MVNTVAMKKLLTLGVLVAGVALFAGCMNQPAVEDEIVTPTVDETTVPTTEEVVPGTTTEETAVDVTTTTEVTPEATAE